MPWQWVTLIGFLLAIFWFLINILLKKYSPTFIEKCNNKYEIYFGHFTIIFQSKRLANIFNNFQINHILNEKQYLFYCYYFKFSVIISYIIFPYALYTIIS